MARPGQLDHVTEGIADLPEKLRADRVVRYLSIYLQQCNDIEEALQQVIEAFLNWETPGAQRDFVLETIGALLGQPRPDGFDNAQWAFILQARARVRRSQATQADVLRVAQFLANGGDVFVFRVVPKTVVVIFVDLLLTAQEQKIYRALLLDTVDAVDNLVVDYVTSAVSFYDVGEYDVELYSS
jgi:hypothetical protein